MKNIFEIMKEYELAVPEDKKKGFEKAVLENYKTVSDYETQAEKLKTAEGKVETLTESLEKFKDVNVDELNSTINTLKTDLANKDQELKDKLADRDFNDLLRATAESFKPRDLKAVMPFLDVEKLKSSKNQEADIKSAIEAVKKDNAYLFQDTAIPRVVSSTPGPGGTGSDDTKTRANEALRSIFSRE